MHFNFTDVLLLYYRRQRVSVSHVAIFMVIFRQQEHNYN